MSKLLAFDGKTIQYSELVRHIAEAETATNPTSLSPTDGRVVEDAGDGTVWIGDGSAWTKVDDAGTQIGVLDTTAAVMARGTNSKGLEVYRVPQDGADLASAIQAALDDLSSSGGSIVAKPGTYDGAAWASGSGGFDVPLTFDDRAHVRLDLTGVHIDLGSWDGSTLINRGSDGTDPRQFSLDLLGPRIDARDAAAGDLGTAVSISSIAASNIRTKITGEWTTATTFPCFSGSGHWNDIRVYARSADTATQVGNAADSSVGFDRSIFRVQAPLCNTGIDVVGGNNNRLSCNAESSPSGESTTAIHIPYGEDTQNNSVILTERVEGTVAGDVPLDIQEPSTLIQMQGGAKPALRKSELAAFPQNILDSQYWYRAYNGVERFTDGQLDTSIDNDGSIDVNSFRFTQLHSGTTSGDETAFKIPGEVNGADSGSLFYGNLTINPTANYEVRFGFDSSSNNSAVFVADPANTNWQIESTLSGTAQTTHDTGVAVSDSGFRLYLWVGKDEDRTQKQTWTLTQPGTSNFDRTVTNYDLTTEFAASQWTFQTGITTQEAASKTLRFREFGFGWL